MRKLILEHLSEALFMFLKASCPNWMILVSIVEVEESKILQNFNTKHFAENIKLI